MGTVCEQSIVMSLGTSLLCSSYIYMSVSSLTMVTIVTIYTIHRMITMMSSKFPSCMFARAVYAYARSTFAALQVWLLQEQRPERKALLHMLTLKPSLHPLCLIIHTPWSGLGAEPRSVYAHKLHLTSSHTVIRPIWPHVLCAHTTNHLHFQYTTTHMKTNHSVVLPTCCALIF
jgi:hypothetical protein